MVNARVIFKVLLVPIIVGIIKANPCHDSPTIKNTKDLEDIKDCDQISDVLTFTSEFEGKLSLPKLRRVYGEVKINGSKINEFDLSNLVNADKINIIDVHNLKKLQLMDNFEGHRLYINNLNNIETLNFTLLKTYSYQAIGNIEISNTKVKNLVLKRENIDKIKLSSLSGIENLSLNFDHINNLELESISEMEKINLDFSSLSNLKLSSFPDLKSIGIPKINSAQKLEIINNPKLESISIPNIEKINELVMSNNPMLKSIELPNIKKLSNLQLFASPGLKELSFNALEESSFLTIRDLSNIESISFPKLTKISESGDFENLLKAKINMPILDYAGNSLSFKYMSEVNIPNLRETVSLRYRFINSDNLNLQNLEIVKDFIHITSNYNLLSINLTKLNKVQDGKFTIHKNKKLNEILIPNLVYVKDFRIDQPTIKEIKFNNDIRGENFIINSLINCDEFEHSKFDYPPECSNPPLPSLTTTISNKEDTPEKTESNTQQEPNPILPIKNPADKENGPSNNFPSSGVIDYQENTASYGFIALPTLFGSILTCFLTLF